MPPFRAKARIGHRGRRGEGGALRNQGRDTRVGIGAGGGPGCAAGAARRGTPRLRPTDPRVAETGREDINLVLGLVHATATTLGGLAFDE